MGELNHEIGGTAESPAIRAAEKYWFKCSACGYDWPSLLMPSIIFVSLSFVTDQCPNCQKRHVPAYKVGPGRGCASRRPWPAVWRAIAAALAWDTRRRMARSGRNAAGRMGERGETHHAPARTTPHDRLSPDLRLD
jgi:hypothetical protein